MRALALTVACLFASNALAENACEKCMKPKIAEVAACQKNLPPTGKTNSEKEARTQAEKKCNEIGIRANETCKSSCMK